MKKPEKTLHRTAVALTAEANNGKSSILRAIQYIQCRAFMDEISAFFQGPGTGAKDSGPFFARVCLARTDMAAENFRKFLVSVEKRMNMSVKTEVIFFDSLDAGERDFSKVVNDYIENLPRQSLKTAAPGPDFEIQKDIQQAPPQVPVTLGRVGVTGLERIIRMKANGRTSLFYAQMDLFADLRQKQSGVHMSRFSDGVERLVEEITSETSPSIEAIAERLARQITLDQETRRSEVHIKAKFPLRKLTPVSGRSVEELYDFVGIAACDGENVRKVAGVDVSGMTACPCAQDMVRNHSLKLLADEGYKKDEAERIVGMLPAASHNQRGRGVLLLGGDHPVNAENLVHIVEASMSSETYGLLKRPDEFFVVEKAHSNPMFAEDVVREVVRNLALAYPDLPDDTFILARQENHESIHAHNAFAELSGIFGDIRAEMRGGPASCGGITLQEWLQF